MKTEKINHADRYWIPKGLANINDSHFEPEENKPQINFQRCLNFDVPCIVLLGPPGIGKSTEFKQAQNIANESGFETTFIPLSSIYTEEALESAVIGTSSKSKLPIIIFLDALDESPVSVPIIQQWIIRVLERLINNFVEIENKVLIRISARTADWSDQFENQLKDIWNKDSVEVYELMPFTHQQVLTYSRHWHILT